MLGGDNTVAEQIIEISKGNADAIHIRSTDYLWDYSKMNEKLILVAVSGVADEGYRIAEVGYNVGLSSEDEVLGFVLCGTFLRNEFSDYLYQDLDELFEQTDKLSKSDFPVFAFHTMGVREKYSHKGVLDELAKAAVESKYGHYPYVAGVWEKNTEVREEVSIFNEEIGEIDDFYPRWSCPECSSGCTCSCVFYCTKS